MNETRITIRGNVTSDPRMTITRNGDPVAGFTVAASERRRGQDGAWYDVNTSFYRVSAFRTLARNIGASVGKGTPVVVHGRVRLEDWTAADGRRGTNVTIDADTVGLDLLAAHGRLTRGIAPAPVTDRLDDPAVRSALQEVDGELVDPATGEILTAPDFYEEPENAEELVEA